MRKKSAEMFVNVITHFNEHTGSPLSPFSPDSPGAPVSPRSPFSPAQKYVQKQRTIYSVRNNSLLIMRNESERLYKLQIMYNFQTVERTCYGN